MRTTSCWIIFSLVLGLGLPSWGETPDAPPSPTPSASPSPEASAAALPEPTRTPTPTPAVETVTLTGTLKERGTKNLLSGVNIFILPHKLKATTDAKGHFTFEKVPVGKFTWVVNFSGYKKLEQEDGQPSGAPNDPRILYLQKVSYQVYETTIHGLEEQRDDKTKSLSNAEFSTIPGANGDPVKAVQNLAGVNRANSFSSQVIIEGSAPQDTQYLIDNHTVPIIFHFGGLTSVVSPDAIDRVDYLSAGYGPEYGRALGGLVGLWVRSPKMDRWHGEAFADFLNAGAMIEGPVGEKSGILISARESYIGFVMALALHGQKGFDFAVAPNYSDTTAIFESELTPHDKFRLVAAGSIDTLSFLFNAPVSAQNNDRGQFYYRTAFFRFIPELIHKHDDDSTTKVSLGLGRDFVRYELTNDFLDLALYEATIRAEHQRKLTSWWNNYWGIDAQNTYALVGFQLPAGTNPGAFNQPFGLRESTTSTFIDTGVYWRNEIHFDNSPWTFSPSLRADYFKETDQVIPSPRGSIRYAFDPSLSVYAAGGYYSQTPQGQELDPVYGNPHLRAEGAWHATTGVEKDWRDGQATGWVTTADVFYKDFTNLVIPSSALVSNGSGSGLVPEHYNNNGSGYAFGLETTIKLQKNKWNAWLIYTLARSMRNDPTHGTYLFPYDQTHILTALAQFELGRNWLLSTRFRFTTGDPYTPVGSAIYDSDNDAYLPLLGPYYSARLSPFYSLDVRFDKKFVFKTWILTLYLDVQNVTNHQNAEQLVYSYDYSQSQTITLLPILPTFGIKGEF